MDNYCIMNESILKQNEDSRALANLPILYTILEGSVAIGAFIGNFLVVFVFIQDKRLRKVTNFYIISLAIADLFVGAVSVPSAILTRMGIPHNSFRTCLTMLSLLVVLCTISILNLVAVSLDRYWAILHPLDYHRKISGQTAMIIIITCWIIGAIIGFLPLFGWNNGPDVAEGKCLFIPVISYNFLVFLYFATIVLPALIMAFFYARIYLVVLKQLRQISTFERVPNGHYGLTSAMTVKKLSNKKVYYGQYQQHNRRYDISEDSNSISYSPDNYESRGSRVLRDLPQSRSMMTLRRLRSDSDVKPIKLSYSRREVKKAQKLFIIVMYFMLCWIPLYTLNTVQAFCHSCRPPPQILLDIFIILSHLNSFGSPFLYAFHMKDFREALRRLLCKCIFRKQHLRDLRRQELVSISGITNYRRSPHMTNEFVSHSCEITPEISPNHSLERRIMHKH